LTVHFFVGTHGSFQTNLLFNISSFTILFRPVKNNDVFIILQLHSNWWFVLQECFISFSDLQKHVNELWASNSMTVNGVSPKDNDQFEHFEQN
jgi:hypothetical protein